MQFSRIIPALAIAGALLILPACKKKDDTQIIPPPAPVCNITTVNFDSYIITIAYDAQKRISKTTNPDVIRNYSYSGSTMTIVETDADDGSAIGRNEITLNTAGYATQVAEIDEAGVLQSTTVYDYDASNQVLKSTTTYVGSSSPDVTNFTWSNGNLVNIDGDTYDYYTDKASQAGGYLQIIQSFALGYVVAKPKNLVKSTTTSGFVETFTYEFDADGKITKYTQSSSAPGSTPTENTFQYTCD